MVLEVHGEKADDNIDCLDREARFLDTLSEIAHAFPSLKIVLEHVTTEAAVERVQQLPDNVFATITAHHLVLTINDVIDKRCRPHHFCLPTAKRFTDRAALIKAATSGHRKFGNGNDSAPHSRDTKECAEGCAGVFCGPVALQTVAEVFDAHNALDKLEAFVSVNGALFYGRPLNTGTIDLIKEPWTVPASIGNVVPFRAGKTLAWKVANPAATWQK